MRLPMNYNYAASAYAMHAKKKVEASLPLDGEWRVVSHKAMLEGAPMDSRGIDAGELTLTTREGFDVARLTCPVDATEKNSDYGRGWGLCTLFKDCGMADLRDYNRIAFEVWPDFPGFRVITLCIYLYNKGEIVEPDDMAREGLTFVSNLKNNQWNFVEWEIPELARDRVAGISVQYRMQGAEPGAAREVSFDVKNLRVERVDCDLQKGWIPKAGSISFSHTGYLPEGEKQAFANGLKGKCFEVIDTADGSVVFKGNIKKRSFGIGVMQVLDFSALTQEGSYMIKAGEVLTRPFKVSHSLWNSSVEKVLNYFYCQRCGFTVPGIHDHCHDDFQCRHGEVTKVINGGWHDAGDLSQGLGNTTEGTYAMLKLALKQKAEGDPLYQTTLEEARWGCDWVLKTRFSDGYRASWLCIDFWTLGLLGDYDDIIHKANRSPMDNILCAGTEALAARVFAEIDPVYARRCLLAAEEDFVWAEEDMSKDSPFKRFFELGMAAQATIAAIELYDATGKEDYLKKAESYADIIPLCQETGDTGWTIPMKGFFYTGRGHESIVHNAHKSSENAPLQALSMIYEKTGKKAYRECMKLYADYIKTVAKFTAPYYMIPASIYDLRAVEKDKPFTCFGCTYEDAVAQIKAGVKLDENHYLRFFPVWYSFRGNGGVTLSTTWGAKLCAEVLKDKALMEIVRKNLYWEVGLNPFNQSFIFGEGYNFTHHYSAMCGDMVGSMPVGVETQYNEDLPYYPHAACYNYKETWVFPALRWLDLMGE